MSIFFFFFNDTATTEIYTTTDTLSLHDALPISCFAAGPVRGRHSPGSRRQWECRSATCCRRSEEHTSELQSPVVISYAVFCLKKKKQDQDNAAAFPIKKYNINFNT